MPEATWMLTQAPTPTRNVEPTLCVDIVPTFPMNSKIYTLISTPLPAWDSKYMTWWAPRVLVPNTPSLPTCQPLWRPPQASQWCIGVGMGSPNHLPTLAPTSVICYVILPSELCHS